MTVAAPPSASTTSQQLHGFSKPQVEKAAKALLAHLGKQRGGKSSGGGNGNADLFDDDDELLYMVRGEGFRVDRKNGSLIRSLLWMRSGARGCSLNCVG